MALTKEEIILKRRSLDYLRSQMDNERQSFKAHWKELTDYILPRRGRHVTSDVNRGEKRNKNIIDPTATMAARTLASGMMSGITSPARPWFRLSMGGASSGEDIAETSEPSSVKNWLHTVNQEMIKVFLKSNLYNVLPDIYGDIGTFATGAMYVEEDFDNVVSFKSFPIGSYMIANDDRMKPRVFLREFRLTVRQVVDKFGRDKETNKIDWENISTNVKNLYEQGSLEAWIEIVHIIKPNADYDPNKLESRFKRYESIYYEQGLAGKNVPNSATINGDVHDKFLSHNGYDYFPVLVLRWEVTGEDVYGTNCPGMVSLGDIKQLQHGEKRSMQAIDKMVDPPMMAPTSLKNQNASIIPGDITYVDVRDGSQGFRAVHEINFRVNELEQKQEQVRRRISKSFFEDLFLQLTYSDRRQITAREIDERHEEKLLALGPVLEQLNQDLLDPLIDITFQIMAERGLVPTPPEEIEGQDLKVDYISVMAQAQKLVGLGSIQNFSDYVAGLSQVFPGVTDNVDGDQLVAVYGDITSVPPSVLRPKEEVEEKRQQIAQAQQKQAQMDQMQQSAGIQKDLSDIDPDKNSLLKDMGR